MDAHALALPLTTVSELFPSSGHIYYSLFLRTSHFALQIIPAAAAKILGV